MLRFYPAKLSNFKCVWISCKMELASAAQAELDAIECTTVKILPFGAKEMAEKPHLLDDYESGIVFTSYTALRSKSKCLNTILKWLGPNFAGIV